MLQRARQKQEAAHERQRTERLFAASNEITIDLCHRLGWCQPGCEGWIRRFAPAGARDRLPSPRSRRSATVCRRILTDGPDHYASTLLHLLRENALAASE